MNKQKLYRFFTSIIDARIRCMNKRNTVGYDMHTKTLENLGEFMPSGSGIDNGMKLEVDECNGNKLVFSFGYHHMDAYGHYTGWSEHNLIVKPSLQFGFNLRITGRDKNTLKEHLYEVFEYALNQEIEHYKDGETTAFRALPDNHCECKIKAILHTLSSRSNLGGTREHLARILCTRSGKSLLFTCTSPGNARSFLYEISKHDGYRTIEESEFPIRQFNEISKSHTDGHLCNPRDNVDEMNKIRDLLK